MVSPDFMSRKISLGSEIKSKALESNENDIDKKIKVDFILNII